MSLALAGSDRVTSKTIFCSALDMSFRTTLNSNVTTALSQSKIGRGLSISCNNSDPIIQKGIRNQFAIYTYTEDRKSTSLKFDKNR
jgi:hypothetical protein